MPTIDERQELAKKADLATKQNILTPGTGITIVNDVISSSGGSTVTVSPILSTGTRIAAITVDGNINTLFAPTPPTISVTQTQLSGDELATITVNGTPFTIYAPEGTTVLSGTSAPTSAQGDNNDLYVQYTVTSGVYTVDMTYVKLSGEWVELSAGGGGGGNVDDVYVNGTSVLDSNKIAQITSYREVTQAEYNALPASKLTDNILYCIKDQATADTTVAPVIYSEEEREVGVWTDAKPLYQKTWTGLTVTPQYNIWTNLFQVTDIDKIIDWGAKDTGTCCLNGTGLEISYDSSSNYIRAEYTQNSNVRQISTLTLQYTKTTDTPGSGKYAPSGVPAVHYSENEQVVGTWVDGSTLYEITGILNEQITTTYKTLIDCTSLNINKVVNVSVTLFENGYYYGDTTNMVSRYNPSTNMYEIRTTQYTYDSGAIATIRYTKQTS